MARRWLVPVFLLVTGLPAQARIPLLLYAAEGNRLRRLDIDTIKTPPLLHDILIERASLDPNGRDINGQICLVPDGSGRFIAGEDTGQPHPPPGWGVFERDGTQVGKLTATYFVSQAEPFGCAFDPNGILFTTEVGEQGFGTPNGQLIMWFPPYDRFPGPPGAYPNTDAPSTNFCKIATDIGTAGAIAIDGEGRVYVASASTLSVLRFSPPFPTSPDAAGGCGSTDSLGSPMADSVQREVFIPPTGLSTFTGLALSPNGNLYAASVVTGEIFEYDLDGNLVRMVLDPPATLPPISTGTPQGLAVDGDGTLYYADLDLTGTFPDLGPGPNGKVWRITFDEAGSPEPPEVVLEGLAFPDGLGVLPGDLQPSEWRTYAGGPERQFFNPAEPFITATNVGQLQVRWTFPTGAIVTASPSVARLEVPGEGTIPVAFVQSWDANIYALRARDGSELWRFTTDVQPGGTFPNASSVEVREVDGRERVYVGAGETLYCLDALSGAEIWRFDAGTGCIDPPGLCGFDGERNEIEASPIVADGKVFFGMDVNNLEVGKGGFYALDAVDGHLVWYFDLETGATCRPLPGDDIRRFDGYHTEEELGLPAGFLASRPGCSFDRAITGCGNVWSSAAVDEKRGLLFFGTANCDTDDDPETAKPPPPMPPYDEAIVALDFDGTPAWRWRPREVDNADLDFGAVPNLFTIEVAGTTRDVVGIGNKDGTYYVLDREGVNVLNGVRWDDPDPSALPYWSTQVVPGGAIGGIIATAAVDEVAGRIYFSTGPGFDPLNPQRPTVHALDKNTGAVLWQNTGEPNADASYAPTSAIPGVVFAGSVVGGFVRAYSASTGEKLASVPVGAAVASGAAVVDGVIIVGAGIGARSPNPNSPSHVSSWIPQNVTGLCVPGTPGCDQLLSGRKLELTDKAGRPEQRRVLVTSEDGVGVIAATPGSPGDPTLGGARLEIMNPATGEADSFDLPAANWEIMGASSRFKGYRYVDRKLESGPCKKVQIRIRKQRRRSRLVARCQGEQIGFSLDEPSQGSIAVVLTTGAGTVRYCMLFGGRVIADFAASGRKKGLFKAKDAPPPERCPSVPGSPSGAFLRLVESLLG